MISNRPAHGQTDLGVLRIQPNTGTQPRLRRRRYEAAAPLDPFLFAGAVGVLIHAQVHRQSRSLAPTGPAARQDRPRIAGVGNGQSRLPQQHDVGGGAGVQRLDLRYGGQVPIDLDEGVAKGLGNVRGERGVDLQPPLHLVQGVLRHVLPPVAVAVVGSEQRRAGAVAVGEGDAAAVLVDLGHGGVAGGLGGALDVVVGLLVALGPALAGGGVGGVLLLLVLLLVRCHSLRLGLRSAPVLHRSLSMVPIES
mmetsp:Transcript_7448/g.20719  ORF Transcript_7448/g.20719 Transcript_7448/m.20719 type:complete len:251 (-) Transcript_7448:736-1488(-)